jgi:hypothetical protein
VIGRREEALAILRDMLAGPCDESPPTIRNNPYFAKLKSDPRFEEILQAFKPL